MSIAELRSQLAKMAKTAQDRYDEAVSRRRQRERVDRPPKFEDLLASERSRLRAEISRQTDFTSRERDQLARLQAQRRSWNPIARFAAEKNEQRLTETRDRRFESALRVAEDHFAQHDAGTLQRRLEKHERLYRAYVNASIGDEDEMREAQLMSGSLRQVEQRLDVLERAGVATVDAVSQKADLTGITHAVDAAHRSLPPATVSAIEKTMKRESNRARGLDRGM